MKPLRKSDRNELQGESDRSLISQLLDGASDSDREKILELVALTGVEPGDPIFPHSIQVARSLVTLAPIPACLEQFQGDLKDFKATAYDMRLAADRVSNLLREKTFSQPQNGMAVDSVLLYCFYSFAAGVVVTLFLALVMPLAKNPLPPNSNLSSPTNQIALIGGKHAIELGTD
jgi:hypothetical protein